MFLSFNRIIITKIIIIFILGKYYYPAESIFGYLYSVDRFKHVPGLRKCRRFFDDIRVNYSNIRARIVTTRKFRS